MKALVKLTTVRLIMVTFLFITNVFLYGVRADENRDQSEPSQSTTSGQKTKTPTDSQISTAVSTKLFTDQFFEPKQIRVNSNAGIVTLTGAVEDLRSKDRAVRVAEAIRGVRSVVDRLVVQAPARKDMDIRTDVVKALAIDPTTDAFKLKINVNNGVVQLAGNVNSWTARNLAEWVIKGVKGVKGINDQIVVDFKKTRPNIEISQDISGRINQDPWLYQDQIRVQVNQGQVKLSGNVGTPAAKRRAHELAWVAGVKKVDVVDLDVNPDYAEKMMKQESPPVAKTDAQIKKSIEYSYLYDPRVSFLNPKVSVNEGVVTLTGSVDSLIAKYAAEENAWNTVGTRSVVNDLKVSPSAKRSDQQIAQDVKNSLYFNLPFAVKDQVKASIENGIVKLTGDVNSPYQKWQARDAASRVKGVVSIQNQVKVDPKYAQVSDEKLKERIGWELLWDPVVDWTNDKVNVQVQNGVAKLSGHVDDWGEHLAATRAAFEAGASQVENSLRVGEAKNKPTRTYSYSTVLPFSYSVTLIPVG